MPRPFYLIGHNPNSVAAAVRCLEAGANALEPDLCFEDGDFHVHERIPLVPAWLLRLFRGSLTLPQYLDGLGAYLARSGRARQLALIAFDLKPPYDFSPDRLADLVRARFGAAFPGTAILFTVSDPAAMPWLAGLAPRPKTAVGVDDRATPEEVEAFFEGRTLPCTYADGTSIPLLPTTCWLGPVRRAVALRDSAAARRLSLVYGWTVNGRHSMAAFLDADVDGLITDRVERLRDLLRAKYAGRYVLATAGDDPFA